MWKAIQATESRPELRSTWLKAVEVPSECQFFPFNNFWLAQARPQHPSWLAHGPLGAGTFVLGFSVGSALLGHDVFIWRWPWAF